MRILHVVPAYYPAVRYGGPIRSVHALAKALVRRGHAVHVFTSTMDGDRDLDVPTERPVDMDGVLVHYFRVPSLRRLCRCIDMRAALSRDCRDFDLMHLHSVFLWPTWAAARIAAAKDVPFIISPRGMLGKTVIHGKNRWVKSAWIALIERRTLAQAAAVHVTSQIEADEIADLRLPVRRSICIPNGIELPRLHTPLSAGPFSTLRIPYALFLSRLEWKKGLDRLIASWKWVKDLPLVIAGNGETGYLAKLRSIAHQHGVTERLHFIGAVSDAHKWALYENATLFVLPSYSENFGNVVAEAMAMGCPVIVTPTVGLAPLVKSSRAGIVTPGSPEEIARSVKELLLHPAKREFMGQQGRWAVRQFLSWDAVASEMERSYEELGQGR